MKGPTQSMYGILRVWYYPAEPQNGSLWTQNPNQRKKINGAESHGMHSRILTIYQIRQPHSFRPYVVQTYVPLESLSRILDFANPGSLSKTRRAAFGRQIYVALVDSVRP